MGSTLRPFPTAVKLDGTPPRTKAPDHLSRAGAYLDGARQLVIRAAHRLDQAPRQSEAHHSCMAAIASIDDALAAMVRSES